MEIKSKPTIETSKNTSIKVRQQFLRRVRFLYESIRETVNQELNQNNSTPLEIKAFDDEFLRREMVASWKRLDDDRRRSLVYRWHRAARKLDRELRLGTNLDSYDDTGAATAAAAQPTADFSIPFVCHLDSFRAVRVAMKSVFALIEELKPTYSPPPVCHNPFYTPLPSRRCVPLLPFASSVFVPGRPRFESRQLSKAFDSFGENLERVQKSVALRMESEKREETTVNESTTFVYEPDWGINIRSKTDRQSFTNLKLKPKTPASMKSVSDHPAVTSDYHNLPVNGFEASLGDLTEDLRIGVSTSYRPIEHEAEIFSSDNFVKPITPNSTNNIYLPASKFVILGQDNNNNSTSKIIDKQLRSYSPLDAKILNEHSKIDNRDCRCFTIFSYTSFSRCFQLFFRWFLFLFAFYFGAYFLLNTFYDSIIPQCSQEKQACCHYWSYSYQPALNYYNGSPPT